ncbi:MAG: signal peptidase I [Treponema sp.]|nr:signal peptidase I [Treponema sp.]
MKSHSTNSFFSFLFCIFLGCMLGMTLKLFIIDIIHIQGTSMEPTILNGKAVAINKLAYGIVKPFGSILLYSWNTPKTGEIVIYMHENRLVIKRCAATAFCPLEFSSDNGYTLIVNNEKYPLSEEQFASMSIYTEVPENTILAIGDNYADSIDSRSYGFIPVYNILGKALCN